MGNIYKATTDEKFTKISNTLIRDRQVSDSAFRLICWVFSHHDGFNISYASISHQLGYGRDKIRSVIKNAERNNYLVRIKTQDPNTGLFDFDYYVFPTQDLCREFKKDRGDLPLTIEPGVGEPGAANPSVDDPAAVDPPHIYKNNIKKTKEEKTINTHKSACDFEEIVEVPEEEKPGQEPAEIKQETPPSVKEEKSRQSTQDPKIDNTPPKFVYSEQTNYSFIEDVERLPKAINGKRLVPWEKQGKSPNNRYDEPFAKWLYENHLKRYTGFSVKGYGENLTSIRGYLSKAHYDPHRMERVADFWNDYVNLVTAPQKETLPDTPLQSFLTGCGDKLRGIVLSHNFTPEQLESIAELWMACSKKEELTILCLEEEGLIKL